MKSIHLIVVLSALFSASAWTSIALASPQYPSIIRDSEMMVTEDDFACTPECTLCHTDNSGGSGTANQLFSITLIQLGLRGSNEDSLIEALANLQSTDPDADSDMDGRSDLDELRTPANFSQDPNNGGAWDPNVVGPGSICADLPRYGCGAQLAGKPYSFTAPWLTMMMVLLLMARRRASRNS